MLCCTWPIIFPQAPGSGLFFSSFHEMWSFQYSCEWNLLLCTCFSFKNFLPCWKVIQLPWIVLNCVCLEIPPPQSILKDNFAGHISLSCQFFSRCEIYCPMLPWILRLQMKDLMLFWDFCPFFVSWLFPLQLVVLLLCFVSLKPWLWYEEWVFSDHIYFGF